MFHSYLLYPLLLKIFSLNKKANGNIYTIQDNLPRVFIIFSVYNEQKVISEKLMSIFETNYPLDKLLVYIGSDSSADETDNIIRQVAGRYANIRFTSYAERGGKSGVLNKLMRQIEQEGLDEANDTFIFTDANVLFSPSTIFELAKHFKNGRIGLVSANILNRGAREDGISFQEEAYIQRENSIKYLEGLNWGSMMGAFGACYAMRANCRTIIPPNYLMEDFYLSMNVLKQKMRCISEPKAICYEDVSNEMQEEFKRKSRIQAGNFQNLSVYWPLLLRFNAVAFCFLSHKVLRWLGPIFILLAYVGNICLLAVTDGGELLFYSITFILQNLLLISPLIDGALKRIGIHLVILRFVSYFYMMNLALVMGFLMFVKGVRTSAWQPTKRNV